MLSNVISANYNNRVPHYLKVLTTNRTIQRCIYVDTETEQIEIAPGRYRHELVVGWACSTRRNNAGNWTKGDWFEFHRPQAFWTWLDNNIKCKTRTLVWAHNMGYDYRVLHGLEMGDANGWTMTGAVIESPPFFVTLRKGTKRVEFVDSMNIFQQSLATLGELVGIK